MEVRHYARTIWRRLWIVILLPLVAAAATGGLLLHRPQQYQSTAVVVVPALSAKGYSTSAVTQYFSSFKDVLVSTPVVDRVAQETGVGRADIVAGLSASTASASSNIINVTYSGTDSAAAPRIAGLAAHLSLDALVQPQLAAAQQQLLSARASEDSAGQALADFTKRTGLLAPDVDYRLKAGELSQLTVQLEQARIAGDTARATALEQLIAARQQTLTSLTTDMLAYQQLGDAYRSAVGATARAQEQVDGVNALIASDATSSAVSVQPAERVARLPIVARGASIAAGTALALGLGMIVLLEMLRPTRIRVVGAAHADLADTAVKVPSQDGGHANGHSRPEVAVAAAGDGGTSAGR